MDMTLEPQHLPQGSRLDQSRHIGRKPVTLAALGATLRRRWKVIGATILVCTLVAIVGGLLITPQYDAVARIRITPAKQAPLDFDTAKDGPLDQALVNTEMATIRSRDIARRVVTRYGLQGDPEFAGPAVSARRGPIATAHAIETATSAVLRQLTVLQQEKSYVLTIGLRSRDPVKAARLANAMAMAYIDSTADLQTSTATRQEQSGQTALQRLGGEAEAAEASVARYRADSGIVQGGGVGTINEQQVVPVSQQLATAKAEAAALRSNVAAAERQIAAGGSDTVSAVLSAPAINDLRRQRTEAERQRAQLAARYGDKFPALVQSNQQIVALDQQIGLEQTRIIEGLRSAARSAAAKAADLQQQLDALKQQIALNRQAAVRADSLQRKADAATAAYNRMAGTVQQAAQAQRSTEPQARLLEAAVVLARPTYPNRAAIAVAGMLAGFVLGIGAAATTEALQTTIRSPEEIETMLGLRFVGAVPQLGRRRLVDENGRSCTPAETLHHRPVSAYAEAFRTVRTVIRPGGAKVIAIGSTLPSEGKTTSALSLARVMALSGDRVLLIDCDVRRAGLARDLACLPMLGTLEVLRGEATLAQAVCPDAIAGLDLLYVCAPTFTPVDLFDTGAMATLLGQAREHYDHVVLDTPPLLGIADARTLAKLADGVLLLVKWNATPVSAIDTALAGLEQDSAVVLGGVLTMVDTHSEAMGGLYYSSRYNRYYEQ
ncbi:AAA family ATPase [Sphingomonas sp. TREG-RG-20F-R18-01]|uniref:GumC family protein n=1 Tax=Sphingomonas sp. TREG-RG-20F-R18-01 TaxID=2914982 RepID=UPI001F57D589|nr:AAA family ATPase [Sphingomonas sp. TREG-RG-20F-R18-01]